MTTKQTGPAARDPRPPSALVRRPEDDARSEAERLRAAVAALDRVRTQLARTQRTLDAFVAQITGTPDGTHGHAPLPAAPASPPEPDPARSPQPAATSTPDASRFVPPDVLADHLRPPAELQPPQAPPVPRAPVARTVPAAPTTPAPPRPAPPGPLSGHVTRPGERPPAPESTPFVDPAVSTATAGAPGTVPDVTPTAPARPGASTGADVPAELPAPPGDASSSRGARG